MIGTKFKKPLPKSYEAAYSQAAAWCNETQQGMIVDQSSYYEVVAIPEPTPAEALASAEAKRAALLASTDWCVIRASEPDGKPVPDDVLAYRQALRDIDQQPDWPSNPDWPVLSV